MTDDTQKKKLEPLQFYPLPGFKPKPSPDKAPRILPLVPMTDEEYDRALKEGLLDRLRHPRETEDGSS